MILDTSALIALQKKEKKVIEEIEKQRREFYITFVNLFEFLLGLKIRKPKREKEAEEFIRKFPVLTAGEKTAEILAELKYSYDKQGASLPFADLLIASIAIENEMPLVTMDKDFEKIKELKKIIV